MKKVDVDLRAVFIVMLTAACLVFALRTEPALFCCMAVMAIWLIITGYPGLALKYALIFTALWGIVFPVSRIPNLGSVAMICIYARRLLLPFMAAVPVSHGSSGKLIATLSKIRVPRIVTLSVAVMFRFMPTIGTEYRLIRNSQKFRGIGTNPVSVILHPYRTMEYILVPLLIRTSKVSDELSAAAMVRGMSLNGEMNSFIEVKWKKTDTIITVIYFFIVTAIIYYDHKLRGV